MSLVGIRDLSLLQTPPADRQPILTYVGGYDERVAVEAIRRELLREGQVFWVHNRVRSIEHAAARLRELVPEARIAVAHGQMDEGTLEQVVVDFWDGQFDVLVCTTIIESGIDMPTVNTLVVERSDLLGLGQMHQLRGRVGRSGQRAYAYLFHPVDVTLTEEAYERLKTIGEATELGSGFKIAMRDLEIRGAGNLLGEAQSGHIAAVGYDLYCQMVTEAVAEMKGEPIRPPAEIKLDVPTDAFLPADYVAKEELRLEAYRRLAGVTTPAQVDDIRVEWEDRYGPLPAAADALLTVGYLRAECHRLGITDLRRLVRPGPPGAARAQAQPDDPAAAPRPRRHLQGGRPPARRADPAAPRPGRVPRRVPARAGPGTDDAASRVTGAERPGSFGAVKRALAAATATVAVLALSSCDTVENTNDAATVGSSAVTVDQLQERDQGARQVPTGSIDPDTDTIERRPARELPHRDDPDEANEQFLAANGEQITDEDRQAALAARDPARTASRRRRAASSPTARRPPPSSNGSPPRRR